MVYAEPGQAQVAVIAESADDSLTAQAQAIARRLDLPLLAPGPQNRPDDQAPRRHQSGASPAATYGAGSSTAPFDLLLVVTPKRLELHEVDPRQHSGEQSRTGTGQPHPAQRRRTSLGTVGRPIYVDFVRGPTAYRRRSNPSGRQPIVRAVGRPRPGGYILDATAGLARDTFLLACLGHRVVAIERSAVLAALVEDGLSRARRDGPAALQAVVDSITLVVDDARAAMARLSDDPPDVVYLDPMYPPKRKSALPRKEMRILRALVGDDPDTAELFARAIGPWRSPASGDIGQVRPRGPRRVVVKRHLGAPPLAPEPGVTVKGRSVRYDVYHAVKDVS